MRRNAGYLCNETCVQRDINGVNEWINESSCKLSNEQKNYSRKKRHEEFRDNSSISPMSIALLSFPFPSYISHLTSPKSDQIPRPRSIIPIPCINHEYRINNNNVKIPISSLKMGSLEIWSDCPNKSNISWYVNFEVCTERRLWNFGLKYQKSAEFVQTQLPTRL